MLRRMRKFGRWVKDAITAAGIIAAASAFALVCVAVPGAIVFGVVYLARLAWVLAG